MVIHMSVIDAIYVALGAMVFLYFISCIVIGKICNYLSRKEKKHGKDIQK